ncbi:MAG TPA: glycine C-acetyltransferase [Candidatus Nanopelagicaceae bacterium]
MFAGVRNQLTLELNEIENAGTRKSEVEITSAQGTHITIDDKPFLNFCSNNYLGLSNHPQIIEAAKKSLDEHGYGLSSVRFICGTQELHIQLEAALTSFLHQEATILFPSCFDANGGIFEVILKKEDAIISDELNHASIIDGIRLSKAQRFRYRNRDMTDLETQLIAAKGARRRLIVTDGVFSMDGYLAPLKEICDLADKYDAMVMVDDSHAVGFMGATGAGTPQHFDVQDRVDIISGTLGKALGGASGGYISARKEIVDLLRQRARPYLFSNSVPPTVVAGSLKALELAQAGNALRATLHANAQLFRELMVARGFSLLPGEHPIIPVMFASEAQATECANGLRSHGIHAVAFSYPVVPLGKARIRIQISAEHTKEDIHKCVDAFSSSINQYSIKP